MKIIERFSVNNDCYKNNIDKVDSRYTNFQNKGPQGLMLHSVGCPQDSALVFANLWNQRNYEVAVHAVLQDDGTVYQCLPWNFRGWHAGGAANNTHIGVEMTEPDCIRYVGGSTFTCSNLAVAKEQVKGTYETAVELFAFLCKKYNLDPMKDGVIISHAEGYKRGVASNHGDPAHLWNQLDSGYTMDGFRKDVKAAMGGSISTSNPTQVVMYRVRKSWDDAKSQIGAYSLLENAKNVCDKAGAGYEVYDSNGKVVYTATVVEQKPVIDTSKVNTSAADPAKMWNYFKAKGLNDYGIAGLMGNLYAESGLRACNLQNAYEKSLDLSDAEYTAAVDADIYTNFVNDGAGYGLAQWTYWSLKRDMLDYFKQKKKSIGDLDTQMEFLAHQLSTGYKDVWNTLKTATSVLDASNAVLLKFERPADQSESMQKKRAEFGQKYFDLYAVKVQVEPKELYRVRKSWKNEKSQIGAYSDLNNAKKACDKAGYGYYVFDKAGKVIYPTVTTSTEFKVGDVIKLIAGAKYTTGKSIPNWVIKSKLYVREIQGNNIVFSILKVGPITGVVNKKYIVSNKKESKKSITEIAKEVIQGKWGNGEDRRKKLKAAGYDPDEVQRKVNELL